MILAIDKVSVQRICSGQVVVDLATAVKELIENSLDAGATVIEVKLKEFGVDSIEVTDNGGGIDPSNYAGLALKHHTSKLRAFSDLASVSSFGFRGEALNALCELSGKFSVTTRQPASPVGTALTFDRNGACISQTVVARPPGTSVIVEALFDVLPVRRGEFIRSVKKQYTKLLRVLQTYALIAVGCRLIVTNSSKGAGKSVVINTQAGASIRDNVCSVFGSKFLAGLVDVKLSVELGRDLAMMVLPMSQSQLQGVAVEGEAEAEAEAGAGAEGRGKATLDDGHDVDSCANKGETSLAQDLSRFMAPVCDDQVQDNAQDQPPNRDQERNQLCFGSAAAAAAGVGLNSGARSTTEAGAGAGAETEGGTGALAGEDPKAQGPPHAHVVHVTGLISSAGAGVGRSDNDRQFVFMNRRPVDLPRVSKVVNEVWRRYEMKHKPAFVLDFSVPAGYFDVNLR